ncbi:MAG: Transglutaminase-like enzyme putative cysteine protease [Marmoricola sp.]|nr:Transglutaminase-like enzyme putative cysteine protease [Marmoricola sp.]
MRSGARTLSTVLAAAMSWAAVGAWSGLVEQPGRYLGPALLGAGLIAATGAAARARRVPWYAVPPAQLAVVTVWLHHRQHADDVLGGWLPTPHGIATLADRARAGAEQVNALGAPIDGSHPAVLFYLLVVALLVALVVDLIGCGLGYAAWTGIPLLVTLAVPISILDGPLPAHVLVATGLLYAAVLASLENERARSWGQAAGDAQRDAGPGAWVRPAAAIGVLTVIAATTLPSLVPLGPGLFDRDHRNDRGGTSTVELSNPMVGLRRDLISNDHIPLLDVSTDAAAPSYLRLTVLDTFTGKAWIPSPRDSGREVPAAGELPTSTDNLRSEGPRSFWDLSTTVAFRTAWLPTPGGTRRVSIDTGEWRYAPTTADIVTANRKPLAAVRYRIDADDEDVEPEDLEDVGTAPSEILGPMTTLSETRPEITAIARTVTAAGRNDYEKAVLLQRWFRTDGGFTYSLEPAPGDGIDQLVRFITEDKVGFCQQFAAAMAVMARSLGIPARVVVGFLEPGTSNGNRYQFTSDDLHAWPEIYFRGTGWVRFEPTPSARTGAEPSWTRNLTDLPAAPTPTVRPTRAPQTQAPAPAQRPTTTGGQEGQNGSTVPVVLAACLALALLLAGPRSVRRTQRRRRLRQTGSPRAEVAALWAEVHASAVDLGIAWPAGRSLRATATALAGAVSPDQADLEAWQRLTGLVERSLYQREFAIDDALRTEARTTVLRWTGLLATSVSRPRAAAARWLPRSILRRWNR